METRRKEVGRQIKAARRAKKFRSQRAFAEHIGVHESSVANAEVGSERIGEAVYDAIARGVGWPAGSIEAYIAGNGDAPWELAAERAAKPAPSSPSETAAPHEFSAEMRAKWHSMTVDEIIERGAEIGAVAGVGARIRYLRAALQEKETQLSPEDIHQ